MLKIKVAGQVVPVPRAGCATVRDAKIRAVTQAMGCGPSADDDEDPIEALERLVESKREQLAALEILLRDLTVVAAVQMHDAV